MSVRIICDSACDMSMDEAARLNVTILPLTVRFGEKEFEDWVSITPDSFYERLQNSGDLPMTSQIAPERFRQTYMEAKGEEIVVITVSSKVSGTYQSACIAAQEMDKIVWVVDSKSVTFGQRILVEYAVQLRDAGKTAAEITAMLETARERICLIARVDSLEYLMRGGRLSKSAAIAGTVMGIKPVLGIRNGEIVVLGKARGLKKSNNLLRELISERGVDFSMPYLLGYSGNDTAMLEAYVEDSRDIWQNDAQTLRYAQVGSVIGAHVGPGALGVAFFAER